jgi:hypothetical protein
MKLFNRAPQEPCLRVDIIGRTIGYGDLVPAVQYAHADGRLQYLIHGTKERAELNAATFPYCKFVWVDPKTGLPPEAKP